MSVCVDVPKDYEKHLEAHPPAAEDVQYGIAFAALARLVEESRNAELLVLRLSTCRNAYLTLNAIFVSLRPAFGHGKMPSPASMLCYELGRKNWSGARSAQSKLGGIHRACLQKLEVWDQRKDLDAELQTLLANDAGKISRQDRQLVRSVLRDTATMPSGENDGHTWDARYLDISSDEPTWLDPDFKTLRRAVEALGGLRDMARAIAAYYELSGRQATIFSDDQAWAELTEQVGRWRERLMISLPGLESCASLSEPKQRAALVESLVDALKDVEGRVYRSLSGFKPNQGTPPLPAIFQIDVRRRIPERRHWPDCRIRPIRIGSVPAPDVIRIAAPGFGIPEDAYHPEDTVLKEDQTHWIEAAIERLVDAAGSEGANVVVFPEYFVPSRCIDRVSTRACEAGMVFIGGVEGTRLTPRSKLANVVRIRFPGESNVYEQHKHYPSVREPRDVVTDEVQCLFSDSAIGTFSVLICSDQLEHHVIDAIALADSPVDLLFVCGSNTHHRLARHVAIADAMRLYCHVVIVNNASGTMEGSGVFGPSLDYDEQPTAGKLIELGIKGPRGPLGMCVYEAPIRGPRSSLEKERKERNGSGVPWLPAPNFRRLFDARGTT